MRRAAIALLAALCCAAMHDDAIGAPRGYPAPAEGTPVPKPSGPLELTYRFDTMPRAGAAIDIEVSVQGMSLEAPRLEVAADDAALAVVAQSTPVAVAGGYRWSVTVVPLAPVNAYLTLVATARIDGNEQSRSVVVPIRTVAEARAAPGETAVTTDGERLILLPAQESATPR